MRCLIAATAVLCLSSFCWAQGNAPVKKLGLPDLRIGANEFQAVFVRDAVFVSNSIGEASSLDGLRSLKGTPKDLYALVKDSCGPEGARLLGPNTEVGKMVAALGDEPISIDIPTNSSGFFVIPSDSAIKTAGPIDVEAAKALLAQHARTVKLGERIMAPLVRFAGITAPDEANLCTADSPERGVILEGFLAAPQGSQEIRIGETAEYDVSKVVKCDNGMYLASTDALLRTAEAASALVSSPEPAPSAAAVPAGALGLAAAAAVAAVLI